MYYFTVIYDWTPVEFYARFKTKKAVIKAVIKQIKKDVDNRADIVFSDKEIEEIILKNSGCRTCDYIYQIHEE